jgi:hypothetical protein
MWSVLSACAPTWHSVPNDEMTEHTRQEVADTAISNANKLAVDLGVPISAVPFDGIALNMPKGWISTPTTSPSILLTQNGLVLEQIGVRVSKIDEAFGGYFAGAKKDRAISVTPFELMELELIELRGFNSYPITQTKAELNREKGSFAMVDALPDSSTTRKISARPTMVSGLEGFELLTSSFNVFGLEFRMRTVGILQGDKYWVFHYQAPILFYFQSSEAIFDGFLSRVKFY